MCRLKLCLYLISALTDFAGFVVVFVVSRGLAEAHADPAYLGLVGGSLAASAGVGSLLGGWLSHRFDGRVMFVLGAVVNCVSIVACGLADPRNPWFLPGYWLLGLGLGFLYPPLIGWLNRGDDAHGNRRGVSRTLILFCVSWNVGMMGGQLTAGSLFSLGKSWTIGAAFVVALVNAALALIVAVRLVMPYGSQALESVVVERGQAELAVAFKRLSWLANLGGMFGGSMVIHLLPDLAVSIGVSPDDHGKVLACWRAVVITTYFLMHYIGFWHYRFGTAFLSQALAAGGLVVIAWAETPIDLLLGLAMLGQLVGYNYFAGLFYSTAGSSDDSRAFAAGIHEATLAAGMAIGTFVGGLLASVVGSRAPYLLAAAVLLVLLGAQSVAYWNWVRPLRQRRFSTAAPDATLPWPEQPDAVR